MFLEKRTSGKVTKYYLVHSYRDENNVVRKIRRYLGADLSKKELDKLREQAEKAIQEQIADSMISLFDFSLSAKEIQQLNSYDSKIEIHHLNKQEWERFTEEFTFDTNAIEGSTVLRNEVSEILTKKKTSDPEEIETRGVAKAIDYIRTTKDPISKRLLLKLHKLCFQGSKDFAGKFRDVEVVIRSRQGEVIHTGVLVEELVQFLNELVEWYKENKSKFKPLALAAIMHNQFEHIHPFRDGNGRVGRLLLNLVLLRHRYPPINISLENRGEYYYTLERYSKHHDLKPTMRFLIKQYKKTLAKVTTKK